MQCKCFSEYLKKHLGNKDETTKKYSQNPKHPTISLNSLILPSNHRTDAHLKFLKRKLFYPKYVGNYVG